jgi:hypothetical protein
MHSRVLSPGHRRVVGALAQALLAIPEAPAPAESEAVAAIADRFDDHLAAVSKALRAMLVVALAWLRWLPLVLVVSWRPFDELPVGTRTALLERMERSRSPLLFLPFVAYKTLLSMIHYESAPELRALGYPGDERTRWKRLA